jgi:hypothetical protein
VLEERNEEGESQAVEGLMGQVVDSCRKDEVTSRGGCQRSNDTKRDLSFIKVF